MHTVDRGKACTLILSRGSVCTLSSNFLAGFLFSVKGFHAFAAELGEGAERRRMHFDVRHSCRILILVAAIMRFARFPVSSEFSSALCLDFITFRIPSFSRFFDPMTLSIHPVCSFNPPCLQLQSSLSADRDSIPQLQSSISILPVHSFLLPPTFPSFFCPKCLCPDPLTSSFLLRSASCWLLDFLNGRNCGDQ